MRFAGLKVKRVLNTIESSRPDIGEFETHLDELNKIELRQLGRLLLTVERGKGLDRAEEYIGLLRRRCSLVQSQAC